MEYIQEITLELNSNSAYPVVNAKQNDVDTRILHIHYTKDGAEYKVNHNNSVALRLRKPDMRLVFNDGVVNQDGTVNVTLTYQCLTTAGRAYADLVEFNSNGQMLSTISFIINIQASPDVIGTEAISSNEFLYLKSFIDRGNSIIGEAQEWANGYNGDVPVSSGDLAYNNHAKYWALTASAYVHDAADEAAASAAAMVVASVQVIASQASQYSVRASQSASQAEAAMANASTYAARSSTYATNASAYVQNATASAVAAASYWASRSKAVVVSITPSINVNTGILSITIEDP